MFVPECQKKFQVVQSVTTLFDFAGGGRGGPRPSLQMGGRGGRDTLWRATAPGRQGKRSPGQARVAPFGRRHRIPGKHPVESTPGGESGESAQRAGAPPRYAAD